jgi:hypothetical protein
MLPNIANSGNLDQLQAEYDGLLCSLPDIKEDKMPLGFKLNNRQKSAAT